MRYLGIDVHSKATVWCLLDASGEKLEQGRVGTTADGLAELVAQLRPGGEILVGQEVGTMAYFVQDVLTGAGVKVLSFGAQQLRMIAASRKKTDRRDAYWIARALQTGMHPQPVYLPSGKVRRLRSLLSQRQAVVEDRQRWVVRARSYLRASGQAIGLSRRSFPGALASLVANPRGVDAYLYDGVSLCHRQVERLSAELERLDHEVEEETRSIEAVRRLMTIPGVGVTTAATIFAWVGDVARFPSARKLCAYAGLTPCVRQTGETVQLGHVTKQGPKALRRVLVQAAQIMYARCRSEAARPLQGVVARVHTRSHRKKIAVVAGARHLLRVAYYVLRDETDYDAERLRKAATCGEEDAQSAA